MTLISVEQYAPPDEIEVLHKLAEWVAFHKKAKIVITVDMPSYSEEVTIDKRLDSHKRAKP